MRGKSRNVPYSPPHIQKLVSINYINAAVNIPNKNKSNKEQIQPAKIIHETIADTFSQKLKSLNLILFFSCLICFFSLLLYVEDNFLSIDTTPGLDFTLSSFMDVTVNSLSNSFSSNFFSTCPSYGSSL